MKTIIGIDPGNKQSGWCIIAPNGTIEASGVSENHEVLSMIAAKMKQGTNWHLLAIEWIQAMGMAVGAEVFETCLWAGRFAQAAGCQVRMIPRGKIKLHHCHSARAKDANIIQSLKDKYGDKGTKKAPGFFYGVNSHAWQAAAVGLYVLEGGNHESEIIIRP
jgi:hypothetical protein